MSEPSSYGDRVRAQRQAAGLSVEKARDRLFQTIPNRYIPSTKTLHRIERGEITEAAVDGMLIVGLAKVFGCRIGDLSTKVAAEYDEVGDLLASSSPCITTPIPGQLDLLAA